MREESHYYTSGCCLLKAVGVGFPKSISFHWKQRFYIAVSQALTTYGRYLICTTENSRMPFGENVQLGVRNDWFRVQRFKRSSNQCLYKGLKINQACGSDGFIGLNLTNHMAILSCPNKKKTATLAKYQTSVLLLKKTADGSETAKLKTMPQSMLRKSKLFRYPCPDRSPSLASLSLSRLL